jgi:phospholipid/cholesterol/gamma-HCH transport system substrate-binding protein
MAEITIRISSKTLKVAGLVLSVICLVWISSYVWSSDVLLPKYRVRIYLPEVSSLDVGAPVRLNGMNVGIVDAIKLAEESANPDRRIEVVLRILKRYQSVIRDDSTASVLTEGLLGNRFVNIQRGLSGAPIASGSEIRVLPTHVQTSEHILDIVAKAVECIKDDKRSSKEKDKAATK